VTPSTRAPGRPRSAAAEKAILDATIEVLTERGVGGLSVEAVAARAGVAKTTIYRRWPTREELILAAVSGLKGPENRPPGESVRADLLHLLRQIGREQASNAWSALMMRLMTEADEHPQLVAEAWRRSVGPRRAFLQSILRRGIAEGSIRPGADLELLTDMLVAPVVARTRPGRGRLTDAQIVELLDTVLAGVRPQRPLDP